MSPITARATEIRVLQYHANELAVLLSRLDQGLLLSGQNPETNIVRAHLVESIRVSHGRIGTLIGAQALVNADQYEDNRGLTP